MIRAVKIFALALVVVLASSFQRQTFKTGVDLVAVEVNVVDRDGKPIADLKREDFEVTISNRSRPVVTIAHRTYGPTSGPPLAASIPVTGQAQTTEPVARRMYLLAVDEHSLQAGSAMAAVNAAERFIDKLQPDDLVGVYAYPTGAAKHDLTTDHGSAKRSLRNIMGLRMEPQGRFHMSLSEIVDCASGDLQAQRAVFDRECRGGSCRLTDIVNEAVSLVGFLEMTVTQSVGALRGLVRRTRRDTGTKGSRTRERRPDLDRPRLGTRELHGGDHPIGA